MDRDQLFALLDIETGSDFQYFENFADLVECEEEIQSDLIYELLGETDLKTFAEICESYFYETMESVPGDQIDLYQLLENIKRVLIGLSEASRRGEDNALLQLADQINRFRVWYSAQPCVECKNLVNNDTVSFAVRDALANARLEKLNGGEYAYDFSDALHYELEEFMMTYADLVDDSEE